MSEESLPEDSNFLELGFDSLFLTQFSTALQKAFGLRITFRQLFGDLTSIAALGTHLDEKLPAEVQVASSESAQEENRPMPAETPSPVVVSAPAELVAPIPVSVAPLPPAPVAPMAPIAFPVFTFDPAVAPVAGAEDLILRQLALMQSQLSLLQHLPVQAAVPIAAQVAAPVAAHPVKAVPAPVAQVAAPVSPAAEARPSAPAPAQAAEVQRPQEAVKAPAGFGPSQADAFKLEAMPERQQRHLDEFIANYTRKTADSKERTQRYRHVHADPRTAAGYTRRWKEIVYPIWVQRSLGSKLWDVNGNEYIDLLNGFGPHFLGHSPSYVTEALEEQLKRGFEIGPQTPLAGEAAEMVCQLTGMDRASFTCTGSEAVQAVMRLARTYTGRDKVVVFSRDYHGNFDQVLVHAANRAGKLRTMPSAPGIPSQSVNDTYVLEYGSDEALEYIGKHADQIAAVIVEPVQSRRPEFQPREFLHALRRLTAEKEIVLVFDEVVTGFRCAPGGAQAYFGVEADLATYGKVIGGGMPIGVVAGRSRFMDIFDGGSWQYGDDSFPEAGVTFFAGTFVRHPMSIAAAHASLKYLIKEGPALQQRVALRADRFTQRVNDLFKRYELDIEYPHFTSQMYLRIKEKAELANLLAFHLRYRGVHILENFPSYITDGHTEEDIQLLVRAFTESVEEMVNAGIFGNASRLPGGRATILPESSSTAPATCPPERPQPVPVPAASVEYPLSELQKEMWLAAQIRPEASVANNGTNVVELVGELNPVALQRAINEVVNRHESLRSVVSKDGTSFMARPSLELDLKTRDLSDLSTTEAAVQLTAILEQDGRQVFDLAEGPLASFMLIRLAPNRHLLVFTTQMIICDGWGFKVVLEEIGNLYSAYVDKREVSLETPMQMRDYTFWKAKEKGSDATKECDAFWLAQFKTLPPIFDLPASYLRPKARTYDGARENLRLSADLYKSLKRTARELRSTPFALLLTAYAFWLQRLSGIDDFVIGVPFSGQSGVGFDTIVGQCVHMWPLRFRMNGQDSFDIRLSQTQEMILNAQDQWNTDLGTLIQELDVKCDSNRMPLVPVLFNLDPALTGVQFSRCAATITSGPRFCFLYDLGFNLVDEGDTLLVECDYNTNLFERSRVRCWVEGFQALLDGVVAHPREKISRLALLDDARTLEAPISVAPQQAALSRASKSESAKFAEPKGEIEKRLARLWCDTLSVDRVSATDNFFDLGGSSRAAVTLFVKIESEFGKRLPLVTLFASPTVRELAGALQDGGANVAWSPLVPIQTKGSKPPLFLVHGAGGNVLLYRSLGEHFAPDYPLYGLQSVGLDGVSQPLQTIEEMAACYVRELRTVQPRGPYYLGGYCLGGTISYEMAQILRREGEKVPLVAMLDTYNFSLALKVSFSSFLLQKAKFHLANLAHLNPKYMFEYLGEKIRLGIGGEVANLKTSMPGSSRGDGGRAIGGVEGKVQAVNDYAAEHYNPAPYNDRITLFKPRFNYKFYPDPELGWGDLVKGELEIIEVTENPHSMLLEPYVRTLAEQLKQHIGVPAQAGAFGKTSERELIGKAG